MVPTGKFKGKLIVLFSLWDWEAFPWLAGWYRSRVTENLSASTDDSFRLWYTNHALHGDLSYQEDYTYTMSYLGMLHQSLRDLSVWVGKGIAPPATTVYIVADGQVRVPPTALLRKDFQPVVTLWVQGSQRADVRVGKSVTFMAVVDVPPGAGKVVAAAWDFEDKGTFPKAGKLLPANKAATQVRVETIYTFTKPGTYFPRLRAASQRQCNAKDPYTCIRNLDRVRVVAK